MCEYLGMLATVRAQYMYFQLYCVDDITVY